MKKMYKIMFLGLILIFSMIAVNLSAQEKGPAEVKTNELSSEEQELVEKLKKKPLPGFFAITFSNAVPQGEFFDSLKTSAQGFSIVGGYDFEPIPIVVGAELDFLFFGGQKEMKSYVNIFRYYDTLETNSNMIPFNAFIKLQPNIANLFYPYVEGIIGINFLTVSSEYSSYNTVDGLYEESDNRFSIAINYGFGAGLQIKLVDFITLPNHYSQLLFNFGARYYFGSKADFANVDINKSDMTARFRDFETKTDFLQLLFGISFRF